MKTTRRILWFVTYPFISFTFVTFLLATLAGNVNAENLTVSIQQYGAIPSDNQDDTKAIQKAIAKLSATGGILLFPEGTYNVSTITVPKGIEIQGHSATVKANSIQASVINVKGAGISIDGLTVDGDKKAVRGISILAGSSDIQIRNTVLKRFTQPVDTRNSLFNSTPIGLRIEGDVTGVLVDNCEIRDIYAIHRDKYWNHLVARGILISPAHSSQKVSRNITIQNSRFIAIGPKDDGDGIVIQGWKEEAKLSILNNKFDRNHKRAIKIQTPGVIVKGNEINNPFKGNNQYDTYPGGKDYDMYAGISVYSPNVTVADNVISGIGSYSVGIEVTADNVTVTGNQITNGAKANLKAADLIRITSIGTVRNVIITDNTLTNGRFAINIIAGIEQFQVKNNTISNVKGNK